MSNLSIPMQRSLNMFQHYVDTYVDDKINARTVSQGELTEDQFIESMIYYLGLSVSEKYAGKAGSKQFHRDLVAKLSG